MTDTKLERDTKEKDEIEMDESLADAKVEEMIKEVQGILKAEFE